MVVLSGMSTPEQVADNVAYMQDFQPLNEEEHALVEQAAEITRKSITIGCTDCRYCTDGCPHSGSCPYYAPALYLDDNTPWPTALTALGPDQSYEARKKALEEGPYGKCVFHNDNDVVDHQVASLLFENGTTVAFTMCAFSDACDRTVKFMGTRGEIRASMDNNVIEVTQFGAGVRTGTTAVYTVKPGSTGHSGGDEGIMEEFVSILKGERENTNTIAQSVHSHVMAFAAEESRLTGRTVDVADFEKSVMA